MNYYKAVRPDGTDFYTGTVDYGAALRSGEPVMHPDFDHKDGAEHYLSVSTEAADCIGMTWPCRLFRVEPVGEAYQDATFPNKRRVRGMYVREELPAWIALGPNGQHVAAFLDRLRTLTPEQARGLAATWDAAWDAWDAVWAAARDAVRDASWYATDTAAAAGGAARAAAVAILVRDRITTEQYAILTKPFVDAGLGEWVA